MNRNEPGNADLRGDPSILHKVRRTLIGRPRNIKDPSLFHKLRPDPHPGLDRLGADGLSSASYGPEEAFKALGAHTYLAVFLALATALTVFIISYAYSRIIEYFPSGGGGYIVATQTLGEKAGVVSGCALLVDYMLTITVSIVSCGDAIFSFFPAPFQEYKIPFEILAIVILVVLNLRGIKESVTFLAPIFLVFVCTHLFMIGYGIFSHLPQIVPVVQGIRGGFQAGDRDPGDGRHGPPVPEGVLHGRRDVHRDRGRLQRPPDPPGAPGPQRQEDHGLPVDLPGLHGGRASSSATSSWTSRPSPGRPSTPSWPRPSSEAGDSGRSWPWSRSSPRGRSSSSAAQAGFVDGPRVMANMAVDYWFPRRFASLSDRFTIQNGVLLMGGASVLLLLYARGSIPTLVVMYSINVFLTFSLSELGHVPVLHQEPEEGDGLEKAPARPSHRA